MQRIEYNVSLRKLNTFRINATARYYISISSKEELQEIFSHPIVHNVDRKLILGDGSNVLFVDSYFDGLILHICMKGLTSTETEDGVLLKIAGGERWIDLIAYTLRHNYRGLERLAGIPGTVGAAPVQNIGAYGMELSDAFVECEVFDVEKKSFVKFNRDQCQFAYRDSHFKTANRSKLTYIITEVTLRVSKLPFDHTKCEEILSCRARILPDLRAEIGTAGSFFANPLVSKDDYERLLQFTKEDMPHYILQNNQVKLLAGWLIEQCGWKGRSLGSAGVWHRHSNVFVHHGSKNGLDLWRLAKIIQCNIYERFQVRLEPEVNIIRLFTPTPTLLPAKIIVKKSHQWRDPTGIKTIEIPADKNACVHLLFAAIALRRTVQMVDRFTSHQVQDVERILQWIDQYQVATLHFETSDHPRSLTISPTEQRLPDLTTASFSRASIDMAGSILLRDGQVRCIDLGGCQFTKRPIDRHLDLLVALGGYSDDGENYYLKTNWNDLDAFFQFDCRTKCGVPSVGVTIHAILSCCALPSTVECLLTSITLEWSVQSIIALARQTRPMIVDTVERTILFPRCSTPLLPTRLVLEQIPIDQIYLFTICCVASLFRLKLIISNFEYDSCIAEYLKSMVSLTVDENESTALVDGTSFHHVPKNTHQVICDIYPDGLPTDISPVLTAYFVARQLPFELIDRIYDIRNSQCREFTKLGYILTTDGNRIVYDTKDSEHARTINHPDLCAHDIRSGAAILLLALYQVNHQMHDDREHIVIHHYEQIERGYGSLLHRQLIELGFDLQIIRH